MICLSPLFSELCHALQLLWLMKIDGNAPEVTLLTLSGKLLVHWEWSVILGHCLDCMALEVAGHMLGTLAPKMSRSQGSGNLRKLRLKCELRQSTPVFAVLFVNRSTWAASALQLKEGETTPSG